jgi:hypothetical protein
MRLVIERERKKLTYVVCQKIKRSIIAVGFLIKTVPDIVFGDEMTGTWV